jgi:hypothetical protein
MKNFKRYITEKAADAGYPLDGTDFSNELANPETLKRINAFVGSMGDMEYLVPEHAVNKLREKLGRLGISFGEVNMVGEEGEISVPLTQFGGRYGKDTDTPADETIEDDGISHKVEGGLSLTLAYEQTEGGSYFVRAKIV